MTELTQEMVDRYRDNGGQKCLFCLSEEIESNGTDGSLEATIKIECDNCGESWLELTKMVGIGYSGNFPLFTQPKATARLEGYEPSEDNMEYLGAFMYPPGKGEPVLLVGTFGPVEDLSKESYDAFLETALAAAKTWNVELSTEGWTWDDLVSSWVKDEIFGEDR